MTGRADPRFTYNQIQTPHKPAKVYSESYSIKTQCPPTYDVGWDVSPGQRSVASPVARYASPSYTILAPPSISLQRSAVYSLQPPAVSMIPTPIAARSSTVCAFSPRKRSPIAPEDAKRSTYAATGVTFAETRTAAGSLYSPSAILSPQSRPSSTRTSYDILPGAKSFVTASPRTLWDWRRGILDAYTSAPEQLPPPFSATLRSPFLAKNPSYVIAGADTLRVTTCPFRSLSFKVVTVEWAETETDSDYIMVLTHGSESASLHMRREQNAADCTIALSLEPTSVVRCEVRKIGGPIIGCSHIDVSRMIVDRMFTLAGNLSIGPSLESPRTLIKAELELLIPAAPKAELSPVMEPEDAPLGNFSYAGCFRNAHDNNPPISKIELIADGRKLTDLTPSVTLQPFFCNCAPDEILARCYAADQHLGDGVIDLRDKEFFGVITFTDDTGRNTVEAYIGLKSITADSSSPPQTPRGTADLPQEAIFSTFRDEDEADSGAGAQNADDRHIPASDTDCVQSEDEEECSGSESTANVAEEANRNWNNPPLMEGEDEDEEVDSSLCEQGGRETPEACGDPTIFEVVAARENVQATEIRIPSIIKEETSDEDDPKSTISGQKGEKENAGDNGGDEIEETEIMKAEVDVPADGQCEEKTTNNVVTLADSLQQATKLLRKESLEVLKEVLQEIPRFPIKRQMKDVVIQIHQVHNRKKMKYVLADIPEASMKIRHTALLKRAQSDGARIGLRRRDSSDAEEDGSVDEQPSANNTETRNRGEEGSFKSAETDDDADLQDSTRGDTDVVPQSERPPSASTRVSASAVLSAHTVTSTESVPSPSGEFEDVQSMPSDARRWVSEPQEVTSNTPRDIAADVPPIIAVEEKPKGRLYKRNKKRRERRKLLRQAATMPSTQTEDWVIQVTDEAHSKVSRREIIRVQSMGRDAATDVAGEDTQ